MFTNVISPHLTVFAGKALFVGEDASGNISLWTTDATGAGTNELAAAGSYANGLFYNFAAPDLPPSVARCCSQARTPVAVPTFG